MYFQFENIIAIGSSPFWSNATTDAAQSSKWDQMNNVYTNITDPRPYYYNGENITNYDGKFNVISADDIDREICLPLGAVGAREPDREIFCRGLNWSA